MSDNVEVPFDNAADQATLLLAAAEELDMEAGVVQTTSFGFLVPAEVAKKAGLEPKESEDEKSEEKPAKKTAAKKAQSKSGQE